MLRGKVDLDRINFNSHKHFQNSWVNVSLNSDFVEDALSVGEQFDRLRCYREARWELRSDNSAVG